jgi:hypothetical protein
MLNGWKYVLILIFLILFCLFNQFLCSLDNDGVFEDDPDIRVFIEEKTFLP